MSDQEHYKPQDRINDNLAMAVGLGFIFLAGFGATCLVALILKAIF